MGYLHAKGIVVKNLNTRNIFLCPKARVSVMDYGIVEPQHDRYNTSFYKFIAILSAL
jgi:tRNA A-37 threonylcarbamoyl transferase component Bud32